MKTPRDQPPRLPLPVHEARLRAWLQTRRDIQQLSARLHYLLLLSRLGVRRGA